MMVVPVFTTSCQVSEKLKTGPVTAQMMMIKQAARKVTGWPALVAIHAAIRVNIMRIRP
jgi:hypothetical protein